MNSDPKHDTIIVCVGQDQKSWFNCWVFHLDICKRASKCTKHAIRCTRNACSIGTGVCLAWSVPLLYLLYQAVTIDTNAKSPFSGHDIFGKSSDVSCFGDACGFVMAIYLLIFLGYLSVPSYGWWELGFKVSVVSLIWTVIFLCGIRHSKWYQSFWRHTNIDEMNESIPPQDRDGLIEFSEDGIPLIVM